MANENINDGLTPDRLMQGFQGSGLKKIVVFTLVVHVVVIGGSSLPYLSRAILGRNTSAMTQEERINAAAREATEAIREIAANYKLNPQEISDRFSRAGSRAAAAPVDPEQAETERAGEAVAPGDAEPERPKTEIEMAVEAKTEGPAMPSIDDDIF